MAENTVFSTLVGSTRKNYSTNAPKDVVNRCFENGITKSQFIDRIEAQGYTVSDFQSDSYFCFEQEGMKGNE